MIYKPRSPLTEEGPAPDVALAQEIVTLTMDGKRREVDKRRVVLGRSKDCDIQLADPNASRRHAEVRQEGVGLLADRPRLDERLPGERPPHRPREARERRRDHDRVDRPPLRAEARRVTPRVDRRRRGAAHPEDPLPAAPLPLHLADRAVREPRPPPAAGELRPDAGPGAGGRPDRRRRSHQDRAAGLSRRAEAHPGLAHGLHRARPAERHRARRRLRLDAPRAPRAEARRRLGLRRRLDERHLRQRREAREGTAAHARRRDPRRRHRPHAYRRR